MAVSKEFKIMREHNGMMYRVGFEGGGQVPEMLSGRYTNQAAAQRAIDSYLTNHKRGKPNGKTTS